MKRQLKIVQICAILHLKFHIIPVFFNQIILHIDFQVICVHIIWVIRVIIEFISLDNPKNKY